jgi:adenosylcobyric acid synthase
MAPARAVLAGGLGWQNQEGNVLGLAVRGVFDDGAVLRALFG